jgi:DNA helicase-2/ATP-dependent DNA helicase PcrA
VDRLRELNDRQRAAVLTLSGPLLVLAGAGTGKTRVITYRAAELIYRGTPPDRILSVTFTNKAAREMQQRMAALLGRRLRCKPVVSTFHALCVHILRQEATHLGYPLDFAIYDRSDQESAARAALREIRVGDKTLRPSDLVNRISRWKTAGVQPHDATDFVENDSDFLAATAYRRYQQGLRSRGAVDFDDLLLLTFQLFREFPAVLARHQSRFDHVQIDEYQDTNEIQFSLVEALVRPHRCLCVVGDDDQSIYGWRGAEVRHILEFQQSFPGAKVVRLEDNYRSTSHILRLANRLASHNPGRHEKSLRASRTSDGEVRFVPFPNEEIEAEAIAAEIATRIEQGESASDIAILFRTNEQPRLFETQLRRRRVPYKLVGGQSFYDRLEIRDMLAYLKVIVRPDDEMSLLRIVNRPARGIGDATVEKLLQRAVRGKTSLWDALPHAIEAADVSQKTAAALESLRAMLDQFRRAFEDPTSPLPETLNRLIAKIGYEAEIERVNKEPVQRLARLAVLQQLRDALAAYAERADSPSLNEFLDDCVLSERHEEPNAEEKSDNAMHLMTLHSAKGLEFPIVYLVGLEEGLLPHRRSLDLSDAAIAEERRLAYVGVTRAMNDLTLTWAASRRKWGQRRPSLPSRFLYEMRGEAADEPGETLLSESAAASADCDP